MHLLWFCYNKGVTSNVINKFQCWEDAKGVKVSQGHIDLMFPVFSQSLTFNKEPGDCVLGDISWTRGQPKF